MIAPALPLLDAIDEPTLLVKGGRVGGLNSAARTLFPNAAPGRDIRLIIRHPAILAAITRRTRCDMQVERLSQGEKSWLVLVRPLEDGVILLRLIDRSNIAAAEQMRTDFVADASHELRTPLAALRGYSETLALPDLDDEARSLFVTRMAEQVERMETLIDDLFTLSRVEAERFRLPDVTVDLARLVRGAVKNSEQLAARKEASITLEIADDLPTVRGDEAQLGQALDNLVANALNHGCPRPGGLVEVRARTVDAMVRVTVSDHGDGVDIEHLPKLTHRFYRVDGSRGRGQGGGTGLGLSIVRRIAERHRGRLELNSNPGEGLTARLDLPPHIVT